MQSDAFPTPPIYMHHFQVQPDLEPKQDGDRLEGLLTQIQHLITDCSIEESQSFWLATDCIKIKHRVMESMQKVECLFIDLAGASNPEINPAMLSAISESLFYASNSSLNSQENLQIPNFIRQKIN
jgi:hypothetical protein